MVAIPCGIMSTFSSIALGDISLNVFGTTAFTVFRENFSECRFDAFVPIGNKVKEAFRNALSNTAKALLQNDGTHLFKKSSIFVQVWRSSFPAAIMMPIGYTSLVAIFTTFIGVVEDVVGTRGTNCFRYPKFKSCGGVYMMVLGEGVAHNLQDYSFHTFCGGRCW